MARGLPSTFIADLGNRLEAFSAATKAHGTAKESFDAAKILKSADPQKKTFTITLAGSLNLPLTVTPGSNTFNAGGPSLAYLGALTVGSNNSFGSGAGTVNWTTGW